MATDKITRVLILYKLLLSGRNVYKKVFAIEHGINERSVDRDIQDVRLFLSEIYSSQEVLFSKENNAYYLSGQAQNLMGETEALVFSKMLLGSGVFRRDETEGLLKSILSTVDSKIASSLTVKMQYALKNYQTCDNKTAILKLLQDLIYCISKECGLKIKLHTDGENKMAFINPVDIVYRERYFWLVGYDEYLCLEQYKVDDIIGFEIANMYYKNN